MGRLSGVSAEMCYLLSGISMAMLNCYIPVRPKLCKRKYIYTPELPAVVTLYNNNVLLDPLEEWCSLEECACFILIFIKRILFFCKGLLTGHVFIAVSNGFKKYFFKKY